MYLVEYFQDLSNFQCNILEKGEVFLYTSYSFDILMIETN
jgi:hypothetical protein